MNIITKAVVLAALSLTIMFASFTPGFSAEIDDSTVFIEAFNAYQQKDYLLTLEKCEQLNQVFPDSPLRDVTLLLMARANLRAGENERAAKSVSLFTSEFPDSSLRTSVEEELKVLVNRLQKGEVLAANTSLQAAARKVRTEVLARERAAELKREMERAAKAKAEQERLARIRLEEERKEKERQLAEKRAKESIQAAVTLREDLWQVPVTGSGRLEFGITNKGKSPEDFLLSISAAKEYNAIVAGVERPDESIQRITLAAGETFRGLVVLTMPSGMVDGHRSGIVIRAVSAKFSDIQFQKETVVISSAPLVRAVAKLASQKVTAGEKLRYRVTILNAGSQSAKKLIVQLELPPQIIFLDAPDAPFKKEPDGTLVFKVDTIDIGKLAEFNLDVKIREDSAVGQELRGNVSIVNETLQRKDTFAARASVVVQSN
ncbi:MAG: hypothetical protein PHI31_14225 [Desulfuromonadaceae bacterium]|nr:hypothetical protein [Desulfuromonadaceae bacterium]